MEKLPELLLSHYEDPYHRGSCERATHSSQSHDPDIQHFVLMQLRVGEGGVIEEVWFDSQGCEYCEAPASILAQFFESKTIKELDDFERVSYLTLTQLNQVAAPSSCHLLAWSAIKEALRSTDVEYEADQPIFGGPSLGEET